MRGARRLLFTDALQYHPASPRAARESPTPVVLFGGVCASPGSWAWVGLRARLTASGYNVAELDLLRPRWDLCNSSLDDIVASLRAALGGSEFGTAPLALTHGPVDTALLQYYLESWPLAGLAMVNPLPPSAGAWLAARTAAGGAAPPPPASAKAGCAAAPGALAAGLAATGAFRNKGATVVAARVLQRVVTSPLKLEPSPVPILVVGGPGSPLCSEAELRAAAAAHGVPPVVLARGGARLPAAPPAPGDAAGAAAAAELCDAVASWVEGRF
jgi:hypothetical protein